MALKALRQPLFRLEPACIVLVLVQTEPQDVLKPVAGKHGGRRAGIDFTVVVVANDETVFPVIDRKPFEDGIKCVFQGHCNIAQLCFKLLAFADIACDEKQSGQVLRGVEQWCADNLKLFCAAVTEDRLDRVQFPVSLFRWALIQFGHTIELRGIREKSLGRGTDQFRNLDTQQVCHCAVRENNGSFNVGDKNALFQITKRPFQIEANTFHEMSPRAHFSEINRAVHENAE